MRPRYFPTLVRLFLRSPRQLASAAAVMLALTLTTATFIIVNAFALSGDQVADRELGPHDHAMTVPIDLGARLTDEEIAALVEAVEGAGGHDPWPLIISLGLAPDSLPEQHSTGAIQVSSYWEGSSVAFRLPGSFDLVSGRWPAAAGEVVLSTALWEEIGRPARFPVFGGAAELRVVGSVTPVYGETSWRIIAAPGTWQSFPSERILDGFPQAQGQARLYWSGDTDPDAVATALAAALPKRLDREVRDPFSLITSHQARNQLKGHAPLTERLPLVHTYPSQLLAAVAALVMVHLNRARLTGVLERLTAVGLSRRTVRTAMITALLVVAATAVLAGSALGFGLGLVGRLWLLPALADQPLSPMPSPIPSSMDAGLLGLGMCFAGAWLRLRDPRGWGRGLRQTAAAAPWAVLRRVLAAALVVRGFAEATGFPSLDEMGSATFQFLAGLLLLTPDVLALATRLLPTTKSVTLTARRLVESDRVRHAMTATTLACCVSIPTAVATLQATQQRTAEAENLAAVAPGQIWVQSADTGTPAMAARVAELVASTEGVEAPSRLGILEGLRFSVKGDGGAFGVLVLPSLETLKVLNHSPPAEAVKTLTDGGVVDWSGAASPQHFVVDSRSQAQVSPELPTSALPVDSSYEFGFAGAILETTAQRLDLPTLRGAFYIFDDLDDDTIRRARDRVAAEGIDPRFVGHHVTPRPTDLAPEWYLGTAGLALTGFALLWAVQRGQARHLRDYAARLMAIGLPPAWSLKVLLTQAVHALLVAMLVAVPAGALPIVLLTINTPIGLVLDIPTEFIAATFGLSLSAALAAALLSLRSLRPQATTHEV